MDELPIFTAALEIKLPWFIERVHFEFEEGDLSPNLGVLTCGWPKLIIPPRKPQLHNAPSQCGRHQIKFYRQYTNPLLISQSKFSFLVSELFMCVPIVKSLPNHLNAAMADTISPLHILPFCHKVPLHSVFLPFSH